MTHSFRRCIMSARLPFWRSLRPEISVRNPLIAAFLSLAQGKPTAGQDVQPRKKPCAEQRPGTPPFRKNEERSTRPPGYGALLLPCSSADLSTGVGRDQKQFRAIIHGNRTKVHGWQSRALLGHDLQSTRAVGVRRVPARKRN